MNYEITEEQIKQLAKGNAKVKEWFPEVFETLIFKEGNWYYDKCNDWLFCYKGENRAFGFVGNVYSNDYSMGSTIGFKPATDSEVLEALTNEAKKRGYNKNNYKCLFLPKYTHKLKMNYRFDKEENSLRVEDRDCQNVIFYQGKWAKIIPTYTKEEAEKMLNAKII